MSLREERSVPGKQRMGPQPRDADSDADGCGRAASSRSPLPRNASRVSAVGRGVGRGADRDVDCNASRASAVGRGVSRGASRDAGGAGRGAGRGAAAGGRLGDLEEARISDQHLLLDHSLITFETTVRSPKHHTSVIFSFYKPATPASTSKRL